LLTATGLKRSELGAHDRKVVRSGGEQILVIAERDRLFAIANRCPHEGYPLSEGTLGPGCVLTCNWHNWKFDLKNGEALVGRDPVRTYEIAERGGEIFIHVSDPPGDALRSRALKGIAAAISDNDRPRMAREVARLEHAGFEAEEALVHAFRLSNDRFQSECRGSPRLPRSACPLDQRAGSLGAVPAAAWPGPFRDRAALRWRLRWTARSTLALRLLW
jgi:nitrite reductase/ring-hydroxylating ferredoxin subunit